MSNSKCLLPDEVLLRIFGKIGSKKRQCENHEGTLWYQKATYTNIFLKKLRTVKFETTVETNNKSISRQTTMVFDYLHQTILIR